MPRRESRRPRQSRVVALGPRRKPICVRETVQYGPPATRRTIMLEDVSRLHPLLPANVPHLSMLTLVNLDLRAPHLEVLQPLQYLHTLEIDGGLGGRLALPGALRNLTMLRLYDVMVDVADDFGEVLRLEVLTMCRCALTELPEGVLRMAATLKTLNVRANQISSFEGIERLEKLWTLDIRDNLPRPPRRDDDPYADDMLPSGIGLLRDLHWLSVDEEVSYAYFDGRWLQHACYVPQRRDVFDRLARRHAQKQAVLLLPTLPLVSGPYGRGPLPVELIDRIVQFV